MRKLLIYDASCPMCRVYTKGLVATDPSGCLSRISNDKLTDRELINRLDQQRARHEIPMIDLDGGKTLYGIDTWLCAIGQHSQQLKKLLSFGWVRVALQRIYAFISYNRRIIVTSAPGRWQLLDLQPDFRLNYRLPFILLVLGISGVLFSTINQAFEPVTALVASQLISTTLYARVFKPGHFLETVLDYSGHLGMSLLIGGLFIKVGQVANVSAFVLTGYALLIGQHFIRTYRLGLNPWISVWFTALVFLLLRPNGIF
ncbi:hypothetical protein [Spirosoma spitsbergense]|uniref:hypothetical protein n=1 Tax=Spirosoma spitsbergense TaxID=431554 RepID=UPI0003A7F46A|nr:hypothetical protein [Spirosoma spitsbergense]